MLQAIHLAKKTRNRINRVLHQERSIPPSNLLGKRKRQVNYLYVKRANTLNLKMSGCSNQRAQVVQRRDLVRAVILAETNSTHLIELLNHKGIPCVVLGNNVIGEAKEMESVSHLLAPFHGTHNDRVSQ